jgi:hypothetical protein
MRLTVIDVIRHAHAIIRGRRRVEALGLHPFCDVLPRRRWRCIGFLRSSISIPVPPSEPHYENLAERMGTLSSSTSMNPRSRVET